MKINTGFKSSITHDLMKWLFVNQKTDLFKESILLKVMSKIDRPRLSFICLGLSLICLCYEGFFTRSGIAWIEGCNLGVAFLLLSLLFCDKKRIKSTKPILYLLLFVVSMAVSGLFAAINGLELGMIANGIVLLSQFAIAFVVASTFKSKKTLVDMILIISLPLLIIGCYQGIFGQHTSSLWVSAQENLVDNRAYGFFGSPNILGGLTMMTSIAAIFAFLGDKKKYYLVYAFLSLMVLVLTFSRSAWLGLAAGLLFAIVFKKWKLIFLAPMGLLLLIVPSIRQRLLTATSQGYLVDSAIDGRLWSLNSAMSIFETSPVFGTGPGTYGGQTAIYYDSPVYLQGMQNGYVALPYTDNQWLELLVQGGVMSILLVGGFFISIFVNNLKAYFKSNNMLNIGIMAAIIAIIIDGMFGNVWEFGATAVLMGSYLGMGNGYEN